MAEDPNWKEIARVMKEAREEDRGHATFWEFPPNRQLSEITPAQVLVRYLFGEEAVPHVLPVKDDPPDVCANLPNGRRIGIEVTELVDPISAQAARHLKKLRGPKARPEELLADALWPEWSEPRIATELAEFVSKKDAKLSEAAKSYDETYLAIMTDEPDISTAKAEMAVQSLSVQTSNIDRAFFILSYDPWVDESVYPEGYPVFEIDVRKT